MNFPSLSYKTKTNMSVFNIALGSKPKKLTYNRKWLFLSFYFLSLFVDFVSAEKRTIVEVRKLEKTSFQKLTAGVQSTETELTARLIGKLTRLGRENDANGRIHMLPTNCIDDEKGFARLPLDWVAVLHYSDRIGSSTDNGTDSAECPSVIDRMRKAFMFGASAIIILTMNPNIIKELDVGQLFSKPVVLVDIAENVTNMLQIISSKLKIKAKLVYNVTVDIADPNNFFTTVTLWGKCGRYSGRSYHAWDGVVCLGQNESKSDSQVDPENFWNYFYMAVLIIMMLHYLRKRREEDWDDQDYIEGHLRQLAYQALSMMKIKRYSCDGGLDTCAICLEKFFHKQKLRVLPCGHHFHTKCVDPWLVRNHTCPLCKLNIIEKLDL